MIKETELMRIEKKEVHDEVNFIKFELSNPASWSYKIWYNTRKTDEIDNFMMQNFLENNFQ